MTTPLICTQVISPVPGPFGFSAFLKKRDGHAEEPFRFLSARPVSATSQLQGWVSKIRKRGLCASEEVAMHSCSRTPFSQEARSESLTPLTKPLARKLGHWAAPAWGGRGPRYCFQSPAHEFCRPSPFAGGGGCSTQPIHRPLPQMPFSPGSRSVKSQSVGGPNPVISPVTTSVGVPQKARPGRPAIRDPSEYQTGLFIMLFLSPNG